MSGERQIGPQDDCVQCGETKAAVRESQRRKDPIYCATVDYYGECTEDWDRHRFVWTAKDQADLDAETAHWEGLVAFMIAEMDAKEGQG